MFIEPARVDIQSQMSIDKQLLSSIDSKAGRLFMIDLKPKFHIFTELPLADLYIIFMCYAIILGNTRFFIFIPQSLGFLVVCREDPRLLQSFVLELQFFYLILFMQFIQIFAIFCFAMLSEVFQISYLFHDIAMLTCYVFYS